MTEIRVSQSYTKRFGEGYKRTAEGVVIMVTVAAEVRDAYGYEEYVSWLETNFGLKQRMANNLLAVHKNLLTANFAVEADWQQFAPSALYLLAAPSVPQEAREEAAAISAEGRPVTRFKANQIVQKHQDAKPAKGAADDEIEIYTGDNPVMISIYSIADREVRETEPEAYADNRLRRLAVIMKAAKFVREGELTPNWEDLGYNSWTECYEAEFRKDFLRARAIVRFWSGLLEDPDGWMERFSASPLCDVPRTPDGDDIARFREQYRTLDNFLNEVRSSEAWKLAGYDTWEEFRELDESSRPAELAFA